MKLATSSKRTSRLKRTLSAVDYAKRSSRWCATEDSAHRKRRAEADDGPKPGTLGAFVGEGNERVGKHGKNATGGECSHPRSVHFRHNAGGAVTDDRRYAACEHNPGP